MLKRVKCILCFKKVFSLFLLNESNNNKNPNQAQPIIPKHMQVELWTPSSQGEADRRDCTSPWIRLQFIPCQKHAELKNHKVKVFNKDN